jgi:hypothetical protein
VKPEDIIGATVFDANGREGHGCSRCGVDAGQLELTSLCLKLPNGDYVILAIDSICPPDMDTGEREQRIVSVGYMSGEEQGKP